MFTFYRDAKNLPTLRRNYQILCFVSRLTDLLCMITALNFLIICFKISGDLFYTIIIYSNILFCDVKSSMFLFLLGIAFKFQVLYVFPTNVCIKSVEITIRMFLKC
ncbi:hypothetical protein R6Q59_008397 [Mikania micrantha]